MIGGPPFRRASYLGVHERRRLFHRSHPRPFHGDDEPESLRYANRSICPKGADGEHIAVLERVYGQLRDSEGRLDLETGDPATALAALVRFTYDHFRANRDFVRLTSGENLLRGKYIKASRRIPERSSPLIVALDGILNQGIRSGVFKRDIDALQLYISIVALSCHHLNNRYTLSSTFRTDLSSADWLDERRSHVVGMIAGYVAVSRREPKGRSARS